MPDGLMHFKIVPRFATAIGAALPRHPLLILATIGVIHRIAVFIRFRPAIDALARHVGDRAQVQFFPMEVYREHFLAAVWFLQQTPPLPHLLVKAALLLSAFPLGFTHILFFFQSSITVATACLLFCIIRTTAGSSLAGFVLSLWFMLSTDLLILENVAFEQAFYENLGMFFVTACCAASIGLSQETTAHSRLAAGAAGLFATLAALTRSSLSYFEIVPLIATKQLRAVRLAVMFLGPVVLLHGGWALKNALVFDHLSWETSTWGGYSAAKGMEAYGLGPVLCSDIKDSPAGAYPGWFVRSVSSCPFGFANSGDTDMPDDIQARDAAMRSRLGNTDVALNSIAAQLKSEQYGRAVLRFAARRPIMFANRFIDLYPRFWQRMGDYGTMLPDVFSIKRVPLGFPDLLDRGFHEQQRVGLPGQPIWLPVAYHKAAFWTLSLAPIDAISIVVLHGLLPLLVIAELWQRTRGRGAVLPPGSWMLAATALYGIVVFNAVDSGENMRFRLAVEPAIIALTAACLSVILRYAAARLRSI